jgi:hypothetical protein
MQVQVLKNSRTNAVFGFLIVGFALPLYLLLLSGFPTVDALKVCAMILVQIISGALIWAQVMHPRQVDIVEGVGMGLAIGSILAVIGHQLFLSTSLNDFGWLLPVLIAAITSLAWRSTKDSHKNFVLEDASGLFFVAFAVVLILKQWWWLLPLALSTGLALYLLSNSGHNKLRNILKPTWIFVTVSFVGVTVLMVYLRQLNLDWWIRSWDLQFFESRSYSIAKFGRNENISLVGYPIQYHWFGLAWLGSITVITDLGPWLATAQIAPAYSAIAIGCLIIAIAKRSSSNPLTKYAILVLFAFVSASYSPANTPNIISMIWFFGALVVAQEFFKKQSAQVFIIFASLTLAALSSKVSAGFTLLAVFTLTDLWTNRGAKTRIAHLLARVLVFSIGSIGSFFYIIGGPQRFGDDYLGFDLRNAAYFFGMEPGRGYSVVLLATFGFILSFVPSVIGVATSPIHLKNRLPIVILCGFGSIPLLIASLAMEDNLAYFIVSAKSLFLIGSAIALTSPEVVASFSTIGTRTKIKFFTFALFAAQFNQNIYELNWREISTLRGGPIPILVLVLITYYLFSFVYSAGFANRHLTVIDNSRVRAKLVTVSVFILVGSLAPPIISHVRSIPSQIEETNEAPIFVGSAELNAASTWLNTNSSDDETIATNRFCVDNATPRCLFPKYFGVSATTRRIMLIEGPHYLFGRTRDQLALPIEDESFYPEVGQERLDLSRGFADKPTAEIAARLRELGVTWFYLFLDNTENRNWAPYATVEYQNSEVAILKLTDPSS